MKITILKTIIKKRFGQNVVSEVLDKIINETLTNAVKEKKLKPSVQPKVEIKKYEEGNDLQFSASFQLMPDIPDYDLKKIIVEKSKLKISDKDIDNGDKFKTVFLVPRKESAYYN